MEQPRTVEDPVNRIIQWRYRTAVQAARMVSSAARDPQRRHRGPTHVARVRSVRRPGS